jgi:hypothetical protein
MSKNKLRLLNNCYIFSSNGGLEGELSYWCGAKEMMRKLGIKIKRRQKLKIDMGRNLFQNMRRN